jgi:hypothetical protein
MRFCKVFSIISVILLVGCKVKEPEVFLSYDEKVKNIKRINYVTGAEATYNTMEFGLGSCDLGYPLYIDDTDEMYFFFGDSFSQNNQSGMWRSNVVGISKDFDFSDGLTIDDALLTSSGYLMAIYNGHHMDEGSEVTKIPTGVIYINKTIYMYYFSMHNWSFSRDTKMNYGGCIKSTDLGKTWERIYDLTWVNLAPDKSNGTGNNANNYENLKVLINEDINNTERTEDLIELDDHLGFDATQIFPYLNKDGYVYLFLEGGYRNRNLKLGRVLPENIEKFEEIEYLQGYEENGDPIYIKGYAGLKALYNNKNSEITEVPFGEMSAFFNPYFNKYCLLTVTTGSVDMFMSENIYGPYKEKVHLYSQGQVPAPISSTTGEPILSAYAPLSHEKMLKDGGKTMYMLTSTWIPCYNPSLYEVKFI